jgi:hypothetical protein
MTVWAPTLIGAVAAIAGGWIGGWWQGRHATTIARHIRREERREAGLMALNAKATEVTAGCDRAYRVAESDHDQWQVSWADMYGHVEQLRLLWETDISARVPDTGVVQAYNAVRGQAHDCASRFGVPGEHRTLTAGPQDFVRDAGRLLMLLGELRKSAGSQLGLLLKPAQARALRG